MTTDKTKMKQNIPKPEFPIIPENSYLSDVKSFLQIVPHNAINLINVIQWFFRCLQAHLQSNKNNKKHSSEDVLGLVIAEFECFHLSYCRHQQIRLSNCAINWSACEDNNDTVLEGINFTENDHNIFDENMIVYSFSLSISWSSSFVSQLELREPPCLVNCVCNHLATSLAATFHLQVWCKLHKSL